MLQHDLKAQVMMWPGISGNVLLFCNLFIDIFFTVYNSAELATGWSRQTLKNVCMEAGVLLERMLIERRADAAGEPSTIREEDEEEMVEEEQEQKENGKVSMLSEILTVFLNTFLKIRSSSLVTSLLYVTLSLAVVSCVIRTVHLTYELYSRFFIRDSLLV